MDELVAQSKKYFERKTRVSKRRHDREGLGHFEPAALLTVEGRRRSIDSRALIPHPDYPADIPCSQLDLRGSRRGIPIPAFVGGMPFRDPDRHREVYVFDRGD